MNEHAPYSGSGEHDGVRPRAGSLSPYLLIVTALVSAFAAALAMYLVMRPGNSDAAEPSHIASPQTPALTPSTPSVPPPTSAPSPNEAPKPTPTPTPTTPSTPPSPPVESPTQNPAWPILDDGWTILAAVVHEPSQLETLDLPEGFKTMIAKFLSEDEDCRPLVWIDAVHRSGWVAGSDGYEDCGGGAHIIWSDRGGAWESVFELQDLPSCRDLSLAGVPENSGFIECWDQDREWNW